MLTSVRGCVCLRRARARVCVCVCVWGHKAAGVIHTDFERGFIKAEVVAFNDFRVRDVGPCSPPHVCVHTHPLCRACVCVCVCVQELCGGTPSMANIKAAGKYRQEGKQYVVQDGE
jgi:hypothetical protein